MYIIIYNMCVNLAFILVFCRPTHSETSEYKLQNPIIFLKITRIVLVGRKFVAGRGQRVKASVLVYRY
jgi:hypothetical protein